MKFDEIYKTMGPKRVTNAKHKKYEENYKSQHNHTAYSQL